MSEQIQGAAVAETETRQSATDKLNEMVRTVRELGTFVRQEHKSSHPDKGPLKPERGKQEK